MNLKFTINGTAAGEQTFECSGTITDADWNDHDLIGRALKEAFMQLTQGKAVFGKPGVGCRGPYQMSRIELVKVTQ